MCETVLDHTWSEERMISACTHPVEGRIVTMRQTCETCGRTRQWRQRKERPAYGATEDVARLEVEG